jgi:hypothetical protein
MALRKKFAPKKRCGVLAGFGLFFAVLLLPELLVAEGNSEHVLKFVREIRLELHGESFSYEHCETYR